MSTKSDWGEGSSSAKKELKEDDAISMTCEISRISFELARHSVDWNMRLDRKVIGYKIRTVSELIYKDELEKSITTEIRYETTNTNS